MMSIWRGRSKNPFVLAVLLLGLSGCAGFDPGSTDADPVAVRAFAHPHLYLGRDTALRPGDRMVLNGPLFDNDGDPVGGYVTMGTAGGWIIKQPVAVTPGDGNFAWRNAIFGQTADGRFFLTQTDMCDDRQDADEVVFAIQNGPLLIADGVNLHDPESRYRTARIGIGYRPDGTLLVADSQHSVTMYRLAQALLDQGAIDAIYLDGGATGWVDNFTTRGDLPEDTTYLHIR